MHVFSKKKFSRAEVEKMLSELRAEYDVRLKEQKNRIFELINELRRLQSESINNSKGVGQTLKNQNTLYELTRLADIAGKCELYLDAVKQKYPINQDIEGLSAVTERIKIYLKNAKSSENFSSEEQNPANNAKTSTEFNSVIPSEAERPNLNFSSKKNIDSISERPLEPALEKESADEMPKAEPSGKKTYKSKRLMRPAYIAKKAPQEETVKELVRKKIFGSNLHLKDEALESEENIITQTETLGHNRGTTYGNSNLTNKTQYENRDTLKQNISDAQTIGINKNSALNEELAPALDFNPKLKIQQYIEKQENLSDQKNQDKSGFRLEEVLNPKKELNLEELCKELGLM